MQAIITKSYGATNTRGARIKARAWAGNVTVPINHRLDNEGKHRAAAEALMARLGWNEHIVGGALPDGSGYAFVLVTGNGSTR